jgi:pilus assembly protein FimV
MLHKLARFAVLACALCAAQAYALGLGDISVKSKLNQPFSAVIPIIGASPGEVDNLTVQLAGIQDFANAGIERAEYLTSLSFSVQKSAEGAYVQVSSERHVHEPFLNFIVEARGASGRVLHEYTVLLDPPEVASSQSEAPAPVAAPLPKPAPMVAETSADAAAPAPAPPPPAKHGRHAPAPKAPKAAPAETASASAPAPAAEPAAVSGGSEYGPVAPQETLWSIAVKLRPGPKVSMDQVLLALYRANPSAFDHGHFNGLLKGVKLSVPSGRGQGPSRSMARRRQARRRRAAACRSRRTPRTD